MSKFFLGPIKHPTWKDFVIRVGGAAAVIVVVIFGAREFIPGHEGIAVIVTSLVLITFAGIQEVRHNMHTAETGQKRGRAETAETGSDTEVSPRITQPPRD